MGPLKPWILTALGLGAMAVAGAAWWGLAGSVVLYALAARRWPDLALVGWAPALVAVPAPTLLGLPALIGAVGLGLACAAWWPVPWARAVVPPLAGMAVVAVLLASPLAPTIGGGDIGPGIQAAAIAAGGLVAYAALTRGGGATSASRTG
jgi:hypothetical protein